MYEVHRHLLLRRDIVDAPSNHVAILRGAGSMQGWLAVGPHTRSHEVISSEYSSFFHMQLQDAVRPSS